MSQPLDRSTALEWAFSQPRTAKLATTGLDGSPRIAPVWVARDGDRIVFNTGADTVKGKALARDPRVAVCFDDETPPFGFVIVRGTAELVRDLSQVRRWATAIAGRYMGPDRAEEYGARNGVPGELLVVVTPTRVIGELGVSD